MNSVIISVILIFLCLSCVSLSAYAEQSNKSATPQKQSKDSDVDAAFKQSLKTVIPLEPDQVKEINKRLDANKKAGASSPALLQSGTRGLDLSPGRGPLAVKLVPGYVTALSFVDASGARWPLTGIALGDKKAFSVSRPDKPGNMLIITPLQQHGTSNIAITLEGRHIPVIIGLTATGSVGKNRTGDGLIVLMANKRGPHATDPVLGSEISAGMVPARLLNLLDGIAPEKARLLIKQPRLMAWSLEGKIYVRTTLTAVWPAWTKVVKGQDELRLYEMPTVPEMLVMTKGGSTRTVSFGEQ